jgi:hypothetical protein
MARTGLNRAFTSLSGRADGYVFKQYDYGVVMTRMPDMTNVKRSRAQLAHNERVYWSQFFYRAIKGDPALLKRYEAEAAAQSMNLPALCLRIFFKLQKKERVDLPLPRGNWLVALEDKGRNYVSQNGKLVPDKRAPKWLRQPKRSLSVKRKR